MNESSAAAASVRNSLTHQINNTGGGGESFMCVEGHTVVACCLLAYRAI